MNRVEIEDLVNSFVSTENKTRDELNHFYYYLGLKMAEIYQCVSTKTVKAPPLWFKELSKDVGFLKEFNDFADHVEYLESGAVVVEPYHRNIEDFDDFVNLCKKHGLEFMVSGNNYHFPGHCFQVKIAPLELSIDAVYGVE